MFIFEPIDEQQIHGSSIARENRVGRILMPNFISKYYCTVLDCL